MHHDAALPRAFALSRAGYYLDFVLAPLAAIVLITLSAIENGARPSALVWFIVGILVWMLAEYLIHRFVFHGPLHRLHDVHHRRPAAYVGVGSWGTFATFALTWAIVDWFCGDHVADNLTAGILIGYAFYIAIHDRMHHADRSRFGRYVAYMHRLHGGHHRGGHYNFGVSSPLFDFIFRTYRPAGSPRS